MSLTLVIGNKNYSSWSMRPWMALKGASIPFEEVLIPIHNGEADKQKILSYSKAGKVPVLVDGATTVWDSLAIIEYAAERFPDAKLWPEDARRRAHARSVSAEMHSGFMALRNECGMNIHRPVGAKSLSDEAKDNVARVQQIWSECRALYGQDGPFLFGHFTAADAMYAPVVHRFRLYAVASADQSVADYLDTMQAFPPFAQWTQEALAERWWIDRYEED